MPLPVLLRSVSQTKSPQKMGSQHCSNVLPCKVPLFGLGFHWLAGSQVSGKQISLSQHSSSDQPFRSVLVMAFCSARCTHLVESLHFQSLQLLVSQHSSSVLPKRLLGFTSNLREVLLQVYLSQVNFWQHCSLVLPTKAPFLGFHLVLFGHTKVSHFRTSQHVPRSLPFNVSAPGRNPYVSLGAQTKSLQNSGSQHSASVLPFLATPGDSQMSNFLDFPGSLHVCVAHSLSSQHSSGVLPSSPLSPLSTHLVSLMHRFSGQKIGMQQVSTL